MFRIRIAAGAALLLIVAAIPRPVFAQLGGLGTGSALSNNPMSHQGKVQAGIDDINKRQESESPFRILKDVKQGMKDADPEVRVQELKKLRDLQDPEVNKILIQALSDPDIRVRMKAVDIIGARQVNEAVVPMSQMLFLRSTEPPVKLHVTAALGRVADVSGALPVIQYLHEERQAGDDERARGTAVFALGEIGSDKANEILTQIVAEDPSEMVRRLAQEALQKIGGELPTQHSVRLAASRNKAVQPADERLAKLREFDQKVQEMER